MAKKILIATSGQPSANPRMVKEAIALADFGNSLTVLYCPLSPWANDFDNLLFASNKNIVWIKVGLQKNENFFKYSLYRVRQKLWSIFYIFFGDKLNSALKSMLLFSQELKTNVCKHNADIYIGHNLGAIEAITFAAKKHNAKAYFDFEDYHRGEFELNAIESKKIIEIENKFTPFLDAATTASPLITAQYKKHYPTLTLSTIHNCFPISYASSSLKFISNKPLKLFWFSQTVGKNRGLEIIIEALGSLYHENIELTLLGNCTNEMKLYFRNLATKFSLSKNKLKFIAAVNTSEIVEIASSHHIGLATELTSTFNRDICLTNKILTYLLAGNAIIFTNTQAQALFLKENNNIGTLFNERNVNELVFILKKYLDDDNFLITQREQSFLLGKTKFNWEIEQQKLKKNYN